MNLNEYCDAVYKEAEAHGWWDEGERDFGTVIALMHSELSEALEENRKGLTWSDTYYREDGKPEGILFELADCVIRIMDYVGRYGTEIDFDQIVQEKMAYNATRPYRHGKSY